MTKLGYWYPPFREDGAGHIFRDWRPNRSLCGLELASGKIYSGSGAKPGWKLCDKCREKREQIKAGIILDWSQIDPQSEDFMKLKPEEKMEVLTARQDARKEK